MSRGTSQPQDNKSSEWVKMQIEKLRRLLREAGSWPETGDQLFTDLSRLANSSQSTSQDEDYEMLSIVVNDALIGEDIMKKYPAFYARMLADKELRTAFIDTLELLEEGQTWEDIDSPDLGPINLDFIQEVISRPKVQKSAKGKLTLYWHRTAEQIQAMLQINNLQPRGVFRSGEYDVGGEQINILQSRVEVEEQELEIRLEASQDITSPDYFNLMIVMQMADDLSQRFEATLAWGAYRETAEVNQFGIAKFPPLKSDQIFTPTGELMHGLDLQLKQIN